MTTKTIFIKSLDAGFVLTVDNRDSAVEFANNLKNELIKIMSSMTDRITNPSVKNMAITLTVDENVPTVVNTNQQQ